MSILQDLLDERVASIKVFDPIAMQEMKKFFPESKILQYCDSNYQAIEEADALLLLTEWDEFYAPDWKRIKKSMQGNLIIDGRNIWNRSIVEKYDFNYIAIGR